MNQILDFLSPYLADTFVARMLGDSYFEVIAALIGVLSVILTIRQIIWCWPVGFVWALMYVVIFYDYQLYSDMILSVIYVVLQVYGGYVWLFGGKQLDTLPVTSIGGRRIGYWILFGIVATLAWGFFMANMTNAAVPYPDAAVAIFSLIAQYLMTKKKVENWYFWIFVDALAPCIYFYKGMYPTTVLYIFFLILAVLGYLEWKKSLLQVHRDNPAPAAA